MKVKPVEKGKVKNALRGPRMVKKLKTPAKKISGVVRTGAKLLLEKEPIKKTAVESKGKGANKEDEKLKKLDVGEDTIKQAVKIILDLYSEHKAGAKSTLLNDKDAVYLQVGLMKKPEVPDQRRKFVALRHGLFGDDPEVCLLVPDYFPHDKIKRTPDEKIEVTVERYQGILKLHGVTSISTIMPMFQFRTEYDTYELKRKLVDRFDLFLCHSNLLENDNFYRNVGIAFTKKNKVPIPMKFPHDLTEADPKFAERINSKINSSWYTLKPHSDTISLRVGNVSQTPEQLMENVECVLSQLTEAAEDSVPGGVPNIKSVMLKTSRSKALPLYLNLAPRSSVPVPVLKSVKAEGPAVEGDLTTQLGKKIVVMPNGDVFVMDDPDFKRPPGWDSDFEDDSDDGAFDDELDEENPKDSDKEDEQPAAKKQKVEPPKKKIKKSNKRGAAKTDASDSEDSEAGEADAAEQQYLKSMVKRDVALTEDVSGEEPQKRTRTKSKPVGKGKISPKKAKSPKAENRKINPPKSVAKEVKAPEVVKKGKALKVTKEGKTPKFAKEGRAPKSVANEAKAAKSVAKKVKSPKSGDKKVKSPKTADKAKKGKKTSLPDKAPLQLKKTTDTKKQSKKERKIPKK